MPSTMKGPAIFLAQFAGDAAPNTFGPPGYKGNFTV